MATEGFSIGACYLAGFAQAHAPHISILIPTTDTTSTLVHIRIEHTISPNWAHQVREQRIAGDMFLTSLLKIAEASTVPIESLIAHSEETPVACNNKFGKCFPWVMALVKRLRASGLVKIRDMDGLQAEFHHFIDGNRAYTRRDKFPNVAISAFCEF